MNDDNNKSRRGKGEPSKGTQGLPSSVWRKAKLCVGQDALISALYASLGATSTMMIKGVISRNTLSDRGGDLQAPEPLENEVAMAANPGSYCETSTVVSSSDSLTREFNSYTSVTYHNPRSPRTKGPMSPAVRHAAI